MVPYAKSHSMAFDELFQRRAAFLFLGEDATISAQVPGLEKFSDAGYMAMLGRIAKLLKTIQHCTALLEGDGSRIGQVLPLFHRVEREMVVVRRECNGGQEPAPDVADASLPQDVRHFKDIISLLRTRKQKMYASKDWVSTATFLTPYLHSFAAHGDEGEAAHDDEWANDKELYTEVNVKKNSFILQSGVGIF